MKTQIDFTRINNDVNGNPRYILHYSNLVDPNSFNCGTRDMTIEEVREYVYNMSKTQYAYKLAVKRAHKIGGRKYNTKSHPGCIVFQSYNITQTEKDILALVNN